MNRTLVTLAIIGCCSPVGSQDTEGIPLSWKSAAGFEGVLSFRFDRTCSPPLFNAKDWDIREIKFHLKPLSRPEEGIQVTHEVLLEEVRWTRGSERFEVVVAYKADQKPTAQIKVTTKQEESTARQSAEREALVMKEACTLLYRFDSRTAQIRQLRLRKGEPEWETGDPDTLFRGVYWCSFPDSAAVKVGDSWKAQPVFMDPIAGQIPIRDLTMKVEIIDAKMITVFSDAKVNRSARDPWPKDETALLKTRFLFATEGHLSSSSEEFQRTLTENMGRPRKISEARKQSISLKKK